MPPGSTVSERTADSTASAADSASRAEVGELPAAADAREHPAADRLLQRSDAPRDRGVVEAQLLRGGA
jgi:hypothetical protein